MAPVPSPVGRARQGRALVALTALALVAACTSQRAGVAAPDAECTSCHGDRASFGGDPLLSSAPPQGLHVGVASGATATADRGVGAHRTHLTEGALTRAALCGDCHVVPRVNGVLYASAPGHMGGTPATPDPSPGRADLVFGGRALFGGVSAGYDYDTLRCNTYCHGPSLHGGSNTTPTWTRVGQDEAACGTCHGLPPDKPGHPQSTQCSGCHPSVGADRTIIDKDRHINGVVDLNGGPAGCTGCHGDAATGNPAPPVGTRGETSTAQAAVGAHRQHLGASAWHRAGECTDCHAVPTSPAHSNGTVDFAFGGPSAADGASPAFDPAAVTCAGAYCHGATLLGPNAGGSVRRTPVWTTVDGTYSQCGTTCHTTPPGGAHPASAACATCHPAVITAFTPGDPPTAIWADATLHIDGKVDVAGQICTSCHGNTTTGDPAPPVGTSGETDTSQAAVGAHQQHLGTSTWHRDGACPDCHVIPAVASHANGVVDFAWGGPSAADGAAPAYDDPTRTCAGIYCHGTTLLGPKTGGTVSRAPVWTTVDGTYDACGTTCHTNPPGGTHPSQQGCPQCHGAVIATYDSATAAATWADRQRHINGTVDVSGYHDLTGWTSPRTAPDHHGSHYFVANQQSDEHALPCTQCHGANLDGGTSGVSCNNLTCHGGRDWRSCTFCHGTDPGQWSPPLGVGGETATGTLAVGRHVAHLSASSTHVAFACGSCHVVPGAGDVSHALGYVPTPSLATAGHHGDVTFAGGASGMTFNVNATQGTPVTARGTCVGACHSNGRGGAPAVTPYWAGGSWSAGSCGNCHPATPQSGHHGAHTGEGPCTMCHPAANAGTHMNGQPDVNGTITGPSGGSVTVTPPPNGPCGSRPSCTGTCHGETHSGRCW